MPTPAEITLDIIHTVHLISSDLVIYTLAFALVYISYAMLVDILSFPCPPL